MDILLIRLRFQSFSVHLQGFRIEPKKEIRFETEITNKNRDTMKIGDKVRFLSEVGGGIVTGFQGKDIVLVQDEDGFDIPMLVRECVVIDTDDYNIAKVNTIRKENVQNGGKGAVEKRRPKDDDDDDRPVTFVAKPLERREGERLNLYYLLPDNIRLLLQGLRRL